MKILQFAFLLLVLHSVNGQSLPNLKVGYADTDYIVSQMPDIKEIQTQLQEAQTNLKGQLQAKTESFQKQYADYSANLNTLSDTALASAQRRLQEAQNSVREFQAQAQQTLQNYQKLLMAPIYLAVGSAIREVALENGFGVVISGKIGGTNLLLYSDSKTDISNLVLKKLAAKSTQNTDSKKDVNPAPNKN